MKTTKKEFVYHSPYQPESSKLSKRNFNRQRRYTTVGVREGDTISIGLAIASEKDNFSKKIGRKIAKGRALSNKHVMKLHVSDENSTIKDFIEASKSVATTFKDSLTPKK
jgi:hypothetical protein